MTYALSCNHCGHAIEVDVLDDGTGKYILDTYPDRCYICDGDFDPEDYEDAIDVDSLETSL